MLDQFQKDLEVYIFNLFFYIFYLRKLIKHVSVLENSHKPYRGFQQAVEAWTTCFISYYVLHVLFSVLTKRKMIYKELTVNS